MNPDLDTFYRLLASLEGQPGQGRRLSDCVGGSGWPARGVYFFREPGEHRRGHPEVPRIVRVGTHAVSANAKSTLWKRLRTHRGGRAGGGNHRGSVFRRHVGVALLARDRAEIGELPTWGVKFSASRSVRVGEEAHERRVSAYLGRMSVLWVAVPDAPGPESQRASIERNAIALLSKARRPVDRPGETWLGRHSPYAEISQSGLWNVNHVDQRYVPAFLDVLADLVARMDS